MKLWRLLGVILFVGGISILAACGDSNFDEKRGGGVAFTPTPAPTPVPKLCGNGVVDRGEECDPPDDGACSGDQECVCCLCLSPDDELGTREFTIIRPPTVLRSSLLNGSDVVLGSMTALPGPIILHAGRPDPDLPGEAACSAPITIEEDALIGFPVVDGSYACTRIFAEGSAGTIDCDGGTAHNVEYSINSNGDQNESAPVIRTGLGLCCTAADGTLCSAEPFLLCDPEAETSECTGAFPVCSTIVGGAGAATIEAARSFSVNLIASQTLEDCECLNRASTAQEVFDECELGPGATVEMDVTEVPFVLTTEIAYGIVLNPVQGGAPQEIQLVGANFTCSTWSESRSGGFLTAPLPGLDISVGDSMNMYGLGDTPSTSTPAAMTAP
jgi:hypothetical protein